MDHSAGWIVGGSSKKIAEMERKFQENFEQKRVDSNDCVLVHIVIVIHTITKSWPQKTLARTIHSGAKKFQFPEGDSKSIPLMDHWCVDDIVPMSSVCCLLKHPMRWCKWWWWRCDHVETSEWRTKPAERNRWTDTQKTLQLTDEEQAAEDVYKIVGHKYSNGREFLVGKLSSPKQHMGASSGFWPPSRLVLLILPKGSQGEPQ